MGQILYANTIVQADELKAGDLVKGTVELPDGTVRAFSVYAVVKVSSKWVTVRDRFNHTERYLLREKIREIIRLDYIKPKI